MVTEFSLKNKDSLSIHALTPAADKTMSAFRKHKRMKFMSYFYLAWFWSDQACGKTGVNALEVVFYCASEVFTDIQFCHKYQVSRLTGA